MAHCNVHWYFLGALQQEKKDTRERQLGSKYFLAYCFINLLVRLAPVVLLTSTPTLKWHHTFVCADLTSRLVMLFKLRFVQPFVIKMLRGKCQIFGTVVESGSGLFVAFAREHLRWTRYVQ